MEWREAFGMFLSNVAALIKVKTMVTIAVMGVFIRMSCSGELDPDQVMIIISMVISFYFGTQSKKD